MVWIPAATNFADALREEGFNGAYAFVPDPTGSYLTMYGISYQSGAISRRIHQKTEFRFH